LFTIDIILTFNTAIFDSNYNIIDNRCGIAKNYLQGWFMIDIIGILPIDIIMSAVSKAIKNSSSSNYYMRFLRIGRIYKIFKLSRLFRMFKLFKN
jgi:hypothetical protein